MAVVPLTGKIIMFLKEQIIWHKMVYNSFLLGPASHQESRFIVKTYEGVREPICRKQIIFYLWCSKSKGCCYVAGKKCWQFRS